MNQNNMKKSIFLSGLFFLLVNLIGFTQELPSAPNPFKLYNNISKEMPSFLNTLEADQLEQRLRAFDDSTGNQIVILVIDDLLGYSPEEYATGIGESWGVGTEGNDNGIVFLIKPTGGQGERETFISIGEGLEGAIPDALTWTIINKDVIPSFKDGDFSGGVNNGLTVLMDLANGEYSAEEYAENAGDGTFGLWLAGLFLIFWLVAFFLSRKNGGRGGGGTFYGGGFSSSSGGGFSSGGSFGGGSFGGGGAGGSW
tara:strand:- start:156 stop:920 length:765 start_codon:yes stop_codon:yes gene_type:complete